MVSTLARLGAGLTVLLALVGGLPADPPLHGSAMAANGMVVATHALAAQAGLRILQKGGTAGDAAIATAAVLAVAVPEVAPGSAGGHALVFDSKQKRIRAIDFSGIAPHVPGSVAGWAAILADHGTMSWPELLESATVYAEQGVAVSPAVHDALTRHSSDGAQGSARPATADAFLQSGKPVVTGDLVLQPVVAQELRAIAAGGLKAFHATEAAGSYRPQWKEPLRATYRGHDVYGLPVTVEGITTLHALNVLDQFDVAAHEQGSPGIVHLVAEVLKLALADADGVEAGTLSLDTVLSSDYARQQALRIDRSRAQFHPSRRPPGVKDERGASLIVADRHGNVVIMTQAPLQGVPSGPGAAMVMRHGRPYLALTSGGGWDGPQVMAQVIVRAVDFKRDAAEAVRSSRFVLRADAGSVPYAAGAQLAIERLTATQMQSLTTWEHRVASADVSLGHANAVMVYPRGGVLSGGADPRHEVVVASW